MARATRRRLAAASAVVVVVVLVGLLVAGNVVADLLTVPSTADPAFRNNEVVAVDGDLVTIGAGTGSSLPGSRWGLRSDAGHVQMVELLELDGNAVTWRVEGPADAIPKPGDAVGVDLVVAPGDPMAAVGLPYETVTVDGPLGPLPTWRVPAIGEQRGTLVYVHAAGSTREEANRYLPALTAAGWDVVVPAYRGDPGAPAWPDGRNLFGTDAWTDLEAVIADTTAYDDRVVLFGASLGGSMIAQFMDRSPLADRVEGIVLDGAMLSLDAIMRLQAGRNGVPDLLAPVLLPLGQLVADARWQLDSSSLEQVTDDQTFRVPTLAIVAGRDTQEPSEPVEELALLVDEVRIERFETATHIRAWNAEPRRYEQVLTDFLADLT